MPPKHWSKKQKYISLDGLSDEERKGAEEQNKIIAFNNRICGDKKAYFFGYVYPKYLKEYKKHKKIYESSCKQRFKTSLYDLEHKENKTPEEKKFISQYIKYSPLVNNNCIMNVLARYIEDVEFDNRWKKESGSFDYHILMSGKYEINDKHLISSIKNILVAFNSFQKTIASNRAYVESTIGMEEETEDLLFGVMFDYYEQELTKLCVDEVKLADYAIYVMYTYYKNKSKSLLWNVFGDVMVDNIKSKSSKVCFPIRDENGTEYLGRRYSLKEVQINNEI